MPDKRAIGIFDSGLGGLTVVREIIKLLPNEDIVYLGDTARVPYGTRSKETIIEFSIEDANFLLSRNVKCIVIACNTASAFAGEVLKKNINIPVFEVITGAADKAANISRNKKIGVIGTRGTISSEAYQRKLIQRKPDLEIISQPCPLLVPFIEEAEFGSPAMEIVLQSYLEKVKGKEIDTLIMGCTHYPIIKNLIQKYFGNRVSLIDPGVTEAQEVSDYLNKNKLLNGQKKPGERRFYVTDLTHRFLKVAEMFLGGKLHSLELTTLNT